VRWPWVFSIVLAAGTAHARPEPEPQTPAASGDFWRDLIDPHGDEVNAIVSKARDLMSRPDHPLNGDTEWAVEHRTRFYRDARNMLAYARKLSPQNTEVLSLLGRAADELGDTKEAIDALETCARATGPDKVPIDVAGRLGAIYLRRGERDTAIRWLRLGQAPLSSVSVHAIINLANALAARGDATQAIDTLVTAIPSSMLGNYSNDVTLASFALAVLYDRDEQRAAAFTILDQMQNGLQQQYAVYVQNELAKLRLPNAEDIHYFRALLYESLGQYIEARAEWAHFAASGETPWRARALDHIVAIDAQRRATPGAPPPPQILAPASQPRPPRPRRHP
jgi:tetratricopeptide (TPR) repeat protein